MRDLQRKKNRLENYDYSSNGYYHLTICSKDNKRIFSEIVQDNIGVNDGRPYSKLTDIGKIIEDTLLELPDFYNGLEIVCYSIMPNHIHILIGIDNGESTGSVVQTSPVGNIIKGLKSAVTRKAGKTVWQKGYYDHIIASELDFENVWTYIIENPAKWENDEYYL